MSDDLASEARTARQPPSDRLARDVRLVELWARRLLAATAGEGPPSHSRGQGVEFDDLRAYVPGDDVRAIDWNVTARTREPFVRQYREDRQRHLTVAVEAGPTMNFGTPISKRRRAAELASVLTLLTADGGGTTAVAGSGFPARSGIAHARRLCRTLLADDTTSANGLPIGGDILDGVLRGEVSRSGTRQQTVVLFTDAFAPLPMHELQQLTRRHRVLVVCQFDPLERRLPAGGGVIKAVVDPVSGERCLLDTDSPRFREDFARAADARATKRKLDVQKTSASFEEVSTAETVLRAASRLIRGRY